MFYTKHFTWDIIKSSNPINIKALLKILRTANLDQMVKKEVLNGKRLHRGSDKRALSVAHCAFKKSKGEKKKREKEF